MILRGLVCIPVFDNPSTIAEVARDCLRETPFPVLIVDDGSKQPVTTILDHHCSPGSRGPRDAGEPLLRSARASGRLRVLRLEANRGKGAAIQAAVRVAVAEGFTHLITLDGDGQHLASEIPKLLEVARENPWDLVIGSRGLDGPHVPEASRFGRKFSNFWVSYQTRSVVSDSQSGFRLYPLFHLQTMRFFTRRYDFEIEVLIRLLWKGVQVREVPIECIYPEASRRVSHFHKLWDNIRISCLNTLLVTVSLLRSEGSPSRMALALGVGIAVGCTPFLGFHTLIAAALSVALRLNFVLLFVGSQVSIPPLAPFVILASIMTGRWLRGDPGWMRPDFSARLAIERAGQQFSTWLEGSIVVGIVLGGLGSLAAYAVAKRLRANQGGPGSNWTGKTRGGTAGNWILKTITRRLGLGPAYLCLYFIVPYFYLFAPKARRSAEEYWRIQRPEASFFRRQAMILRQLLTFGRLLLDRIHQGSSSQPRFRSRPHGMEHILEALSSRKGAILLAAHAGGWDMAAALLRADGLSTQFHSVQYEARALTFPKVLGKSAQREDLRTLTIPEGPDPGSQPVLRIRELLARGNPVGLMGDRPLGGAFELVLFLGKLAPFDVTPFRIAAACEAPLLFVFGFKGKGDHYDFHSSPPRVLRFPPGVDRARQCLSWAQEYATTLEALLRRYPEQWSNFFPFWSSPPNLPAGVPPARTRNHWSEEPRTPPMPEAGLAPGPTASAAPESQA